MNQGRIARRFRAARSPARAAPASSPSSPPATRTCRGQRRILARLPAAGADVIELGMPFSDPMADGPAVQAAGLRALKAGRPWSGRWRAGPATSGPATRTRRSS